MRARTFQSLLGVLILSLLSGACTTFAPEDSNPEALFKLAEEEIKGNRYLMAIDKLRMVKNKFPYSKFAAEAQLRIADVYFLQESFTEAALGYETFRDLYPKHPKTGYATFRIAKSYFGESPENVSRDQTPTLKALEGYQEFLRRHPDSPESAEARTDAAEATRRLAQKEYEIARFYMKRRDYSSARSRLQKLIRLYPQSSVAAEAQKRLEKLPAVDGKEAPEGSNDDGSQS